MSNEIQDILLQPPINKKSVGDLSGSANNGCFNGKVHSNTNPNKRA